MGEFDKNYREREADLQILSLGAGVQSTTILMLSAEGILPKLDAAIFSDTGWEPGEVYDHLNRLEEEIAKPAGVPIYRVSNGNIRYDVLDPTKRSASMPLFIKNADGSGGMMKRKCTSEYKITPIKKQVRQLLGAQTLEDGRIGRVPKGMLGEQWIGISTDEWSRAKDSDVAYIRHRFPLLYDVQWDRNACIEYLQKRGWGSTPKSACIGCPFHNNKMWRDLKTNSPEEWADAVEFDAAIRKGSAKAIANGDLLKGEAYLHKDMIPLSEVNVDYVSPKERNAVFNDTLDFFKVNIEEDLAGCSPFGCRADEHEIGRESEPIEEDEDDRYED